MSDKFIELLGLLEWRIELLEESIESWQKSPSEATAAGIEDKSHYGEYIAGVIDQARDEQKYLSKIIEQVKREQ